jgi:hypothetical protein
MEQKTLKNQTQVNQTQVNQTQINQNQQVKKGLKQLSLTIGSRSAKLKGSESWQQIIEYISNYEKTNLIELLKEVDFKYNVIYEIDPILSSNEVLYIRILTEKRKNILILGVTSNFELVGFKVLYEEENKNPQVQNQEVQNQEVQNGQVNQKSKK